MTSSELKTQDGQTDGRGATLNAAWEGGQHNKLLMKWNEFTQRYVLFLFFLRGRLHGATMPTTVMLFKGASMPHGSSRLLFIVRILHI